MNTASKPNKRTTCFYCLRNSCFYYVNMWNIWLYCVRKQLFLTCENICFYCVRKHLFLLYEEGKHLFLLCEETSVSWETAVWETSVMSHASCFCRKHLFRKQRETSVWETSVMSHTTCFGKKELFEKQMLWHTRCFQKKHLFLTWFILCPYKLGWKHVQHIIVYTFGSERYIYLHFASWNSSFEIGIMDARQNQSKYYIL